MSYLDLLRRPHVARLLSGTLIGRLPAGMAILAIPLALRRAGASYAFVGIVGGVFALSAATGGPLLGRSVDKVGQPRVLIPTAVAAGVGFLIIAAAPHRSVPVVLGAALAGAATPPLEPCLRALWPRIVDPRRLETAYAMDSGSQQLIFVGAPLLVAGLTAAVSPTLALGAAALLGLIGVAIVVTSTPSRQWSAENRSADWLGPLRSGGLIVLFTALTGTGLAIGVLNVLTVSYAEQHTFPGGAGTLLALNAAGALAGALGYGTVRWKVSLEARALLLASGMASGYALLCVVPSPPFMALLMLGTGVFLAPLLTVSFVLVDRLAPVGTTTEAFAWLVTVFTSGTAVGAAVVGTVLEHHGSHWAAACGALATAAGALTLYGGRRLLHERASVSHESVDVEAY